MPDQLGLMKRSMSVYAAPEGMKDFGKSCATPKSSTIARDDFALGDFDASSPSKIANFEAPVVARRSTMASMGRGKKQKGLDINIEAASPIQEEDEEDDANPFEE